MFRRSMRQVDLAERSGLSVRTISDLERGISAAPRLSTLDLLERGLDLAAADWHLVLDADPQRPEARAQVRPEPVA